MTETPDHKFGNFFKILYEDNHLIIVDKKAGLLVQGDVTEDIPLVEYVKKYLKQKYNKPGKVFCGVIHRIDRPVSGLVVLAKTSKCLERMGALFKQKKVSRTYWAIVKNTPDPPGSKLVHWLVKDPSKNMTRAHHQEVKNSKKAELWYELKGRLNKHNLLEVQPLSGRPHQIRAQLAAIGCPIKGDIKYGFKQPNKDKCINLHSKSIRFVHPVKKETVFCMAPLPEDPFWQQYAVFEDLKDEELNLLLKNQ